MRLDILEQSPDFVLIEVSFDSPVDAAKTLGFSGQEKYIFVTRGKRRNFKITYRDGSTKHFWVDDDGSMSVSYDAQILKDCIIQFLLGAGINLRAHHDSLQFDVLPVDQFGITKNIIFLADREVYTLPEEMDLQTIFKNLQFIDTFGNGRKLYEFSIQTSKTFN